VERKLSLHWIGTQNFHREVTRSCRKNDFLEAEKWAKQFISEKEAFESCLTNRSFQTHFSRIEGQVQQAELAKIDRHTPISDVPEKWQNAFAIARGRAIAEKVSFLPNKDIDTRVSFIDRYENGMVKIEEDNMVEFEVSTIVKETGYNPYTNYINIEKGIITADHNFRNQDVTGDGKPLPNSEILYHQLLFVLRDQQIDPSEFNLKQVIRKGIQNEETFNTLNCCINNLPDVQSASNSRYRFAKGMDGYYVLLGTPNVYGILYLLKQHPSLFGKKEITSIEVFKEDYQLPDIILHIGEREGVG
jgi:hypothetical protein